MEVTVLTFPFPFSKGSLLIVKRGRDAYRERENAIKKLGEREIWEKDALKRKETERE